MKNTSSVNKNTKFSSKKTSKTIVISLHEMVKKAERSYGDVIRKLAHE